MKRKIYNSRKDAKSQNYILINFLASLRLSERYFNYKVKIFAQKIPLTSGILNKSS